MVWITFFLAFEVSKKSRVLPKHPRDELYTMISSFEVHLVKETLPEMSKLYESLPSMLLISVVFPAPLGPKIAFKLPLGTERLTLSRMVLPLKVTVRSLMFSRSGSLTSERFPILKTSEISLALKVGSTISQMVLVIFSLKAAISSSP